MKTRLLILSSCIGLATISGRANLILSTLNSTVSEDFNSFDGSGFAPLPAVGQLNSNTWRVEGLSDGDGTFGGTHTTGDFARGIDGDGASTGGVYAFETSTGDFSLGVQPIGSDFNPGTFTVRLLNDTGGSISQLNISYEIKVFNDQDRSNTFNFAHSSDDSTYTDVSALNYTSTEAAAGTPVWETISRNTSLTGLNIANGQNYYLQWQGADVGGSGSRDEFGLDDLSVTAIPEPSSVMLVGLTALAALGILRRRRK